MSNHRRRGLFGLPCPSHPSMEVIQVIDSCPFRPLRVHYWITILVPYLNLLSKESTLEWKQGPSFRDSFSVPDLSPYHVGSLVQALNDSITDSESTLWHHLLNRQHVYIHESALPCQEVSCRRAWICTILTITAKEYYTCLGNRGANVIQVAWARLSLQERILVGTLLILFGLVTTIWRLNRFGRLIFSIGVTIALGSNIFLTAPILSFLDSLPESSSILLGYCISSLFVKV